MARLLFAMQVQPMKAIRACRVLPATPVITAISREKAVALLAQIVLIADRDLLYAQASALKVMVVRLLRMVARQLLSVLLVLSIAAVKV